MGVEVRPSVTSTLTSREVTHPAGSSRRPSYAIVLGGGGVTLMRDAQYPLRVSGVITRGSRFATVRDRASVPDPGGSDRSSGPDPVFTRHPARRETRSSSRWETFGPSGRPAGKPGDPVVKTPRPRGTNHPGSPLEIAAQKAKDAPS